MSVVAIVKMNHSAWLAMAQISLKEKLEFNLSYLELLLAWSLGPGPVRYLNNPEPKVASGFTYGSCLL